MSPAVHRADFDSHGCGSRRLPSPSVADRRPDGFKVVDRLPSPRPRARFRVRPPAGVSGYVNHRIPQGGNQR
jgi:hypothetical protein